MSEVTIHWLLQNRNRPSLMDPTSVILLYLIVCLLGYSSPILIEGIKLFRMMSTPPELYIVTNPQAGFVDLSPIKVEMASQFPGIFIQEIPHTQLYQMLTTFSPKPNRVFLLLTNSMMPGQQTVSLLSRIDALGSGVIMYPTSVSTNPYHLLARTPQEVIYNFGMLQKQAGGAYSSPMLGAPGVLTSAADINSARLGVNIFKSNNEIFKRDMNSIYQTYRNDRRIKFNQINNLSQIPIIPGGQHLIFVSDADANLFIPQLNMVSGRPDKFFPVLYNTSSRTIPTGQYFNLATNNLQRVHTEISSYLANIGTTGTLGSMGSIPDVNMMTRVPISTIPMTGPVVPSSTSRTIIQNTVPATGGPYTRLIVLDPGTLYFQQFYRSLPVDYLLINHLEQNAIFKQPTILLAPYDAMPHVLNRISPETGNVRCVFYSAAANYNHAPHRFISLVSNNTREIQNYLRANNVLFMSNTVTTMKNVSLESNLYGVGSNAFTTTVNMSPYANALWGIDGPRNYAYQWVVKRKPGGQRHLTFLADQEQMYMNRTANTRMLGSLESRHDFEINSIPNQSQMMMNRTTFQSPPKNAYTSQVNQVITETVTHVNPVPQTSRVVEQIYQETVIQAKNRAPSTFYQQTTVDQIPITPIIEQTIVTPPPTTRTFTVNQPSTLQMNIQPAVVKQVIRQQIILPPPQTTIIQVPPITNGYYASSTRTIPIQTNHVVSVSPPKILPTTNVNVVSRKVLEPEWVDPIKYQKTVQNGKVIYVMRQEYKNRLIQDALAKPGLTTYNEVDYVVDSPRIQRRSRVLYDTVVKPTYNQIEYMVDSPRVMRKSRVIYQDAPTTTIISPNTQVLQTSIVSPPLDPFNYETRIQNGVQVYYKRNSVSPLRRSNHLVVDQYATPVQYTTMTAPTVVVNQPQVLRRSIVLDQRMPRTNSRVIVQQSPEVIELRRSNVGLRGSRVYRTSRVGDVIVNRHSQPVHLVFKKLNSMLVSTSQLFNDPNYRIHKYYSTNQLAGIANNIPFNEPVILVADEAPETIDYFTNHANFSTVVIPKNRSTYRAQQIKYPKYKWILQEDPERAYGEILTHIDELVYNPRSANNYYRTSRVAGDVHYLSPNNYNTYTTNSYNINKDYRPRVNLSAKKVMLFPIQRSQVKDFVQSRLPNTFDFIPYTDMNSLTKELDSWPGTNLVVILAEPLARQVGTITRISRNAQYIIYDPDNRFGYNKQDYNAIRRVRTVHDLVTELEGMLLGGTRSNEFRRENRSYHY